MALIIKRIKIGSIKINKEFLEKLGYLLEEDVNVRDKEYKQNFDLLKKKYSLKSPAAYKAWHTTHKKPLYGVTYTIKTNDDELQVSSMDEFLSRKIFPNKIESMTFDINHYHESKYLDIRINLDEGFFGNVCKISSDNESKMLLFEKNFKDLLKEYETNYNWFLKISDLSLFKFLVEPIFGVFISLLFIVNLDKLFIDLNENTIISIFVFSCIFIFLLTEKIRTFLYPRYSFELTNKNNSKVIRYVIQVIIVSLVLAFIHDLIKIIM